MKERRKKIEHIGKYITEQIKVRGIASLSEILREAKSMYEESLRGIVKDIEQSWKPFKGNILEKVILELISEEVKKLNLNVMFGKHLEKKDSNLDECLGNVKRSILIDYGEFGMHLPDVDLIIYDPKTCKALAIISSKTTLRERIAQTGYWKLKLQSSPVTKNIKVFFITLDEDDDLVVKKPAKKGRAIAETDTDGTFVITTQPIEESEKVKNMEKFAEVLHILINKTKKDL
jgi:type II restriction enzyme